MLDTKSYFYLYVGCTRVTSKTSWWTIKNDFNDAQAILRCRHPDEQARGGD